MESHLCWYFQFEVKQLNIHLFQYHVMKPSYRAASVQGSSHTEMNKICWCLSCLKAIPLDLRAIVRNKNKYWHGVLTLSFSIPCPKANSAMWETMQQNFFNNT